MSTKKLNFAELIIIRINETEATDIIYDGSHRAAS